MKSVAIIPARYHSTRLKAKALIGIEGKSLIRRVYERVKTMELFDRVIVATDDKRILDEVNSFGGEARMTSADHQSGTDRCAEVVRQLKAKKQTFDVVVNVQGDEPEIGKAELSGLHNMFSDEDVSIATLITSITDKDDMFDPSVVKVVRSNVGKALYFSRQAIPHIRNEKKDKWISSHRYFQHIGVYAFRPEILLKIAKLPLSKLESAESLEQLRWLENGLQIHLFETSNKTIGIDTEEDVKNFINNLKHKKGF